MQQQQKQLGSTYSTGANFSTTVVGNSATKSPNSSVDRKVIDTLQKVPNQFGPRIPGCPQPFPLVKRNILRTICPGGPNCGWGPFVHGHQILGDHFSMGTELVGDRLSRGTNQLGTNCGGPNVRGPNVSQPYP